MNKLKRRYIYEEDYEEIVAWFISRRNVFNLRSPNNRENFPYMLSKYIEYRGR